MHFQNSVLLISCEMWPLLFLLLGALMWFLGWLFGRSKVNKLKGELDIANQKNKSLISENQQIQEDLKIVRSDYEKTNRSLISAENNLESSNNKLNSALSKTRMIETEKNKIASEKNSLLSEKNNLVSERNSLLSEKNNLVSEKNSLLSEKSGWDEERSKLQTNSLNAADENISNKAIASLREKLADTERALVECQSSKIKHDNVSFVAPPPPPSSGGINSLVSDTSGMDGADDIPSVSNLEPTGKFESGKFESGKSESGRFESGKSESGRFESGRFESGRFESGRFESGKSESGMGKYFNNNNLQIMEGVGPKIESLLKNAGYNTWGDIANASDSDLQKVLDDAGPRYRMHNAADWSRQSRYASKGQWDQLVQYQKDIDEGVSEPNSKAEKLYFKAMGFAAAKPDDLKVVEGVGPKIESLLKSAGIKNWSMLAESDISRLQDILTSAGDRYRLADPGTWPKQAELAAAGKWTELKEYQDFLSGGKA